ncbi:PAS domain S-box protein, partial [Chloroflexota bacterium]
RQREQELKGDKTKYLELEALFDSLFTISPIGLYIVQAGYFVKVSSEFIRLTGYEENELIGMRSLDIVVPEDRDIVREKAIGSLKNQRSGGYEFRIITKKGETRNVYELITSIHYLGRPATLSNFIDDTERARMFEALRDSEHNFQNSIDNSPIGIRVTDYEGNNLYVNQALLNIWGYKSFEELQSIPREKLFTSASDNALFKRRQSRKLGKHVPISYELSIVRKDGQIRQLLTHGGELQWEGKKSLQSFYQDITEQKKAQELLNSTMADLKRSNTDLEHFAYVVSHDLQEPLRAVSGFTGLLAKRYKDKLDTDANEFISYILSGVSRMQSLIDGLLNYSRIATHGRPFESTDCEAVLKNVLDAVKVTIEENRAVITHNTLPTIMADISQISQLFQNLILNAIKFRSEAPPHIHIEALEKGEIWEFSFRDNGIGIESSASESVFLIFRRLHTEEEYSGIGLGLSICKKIVERHEGQIWIESQLGEGSTFYFTIPIEKGESHE